jgi:phospholipid/cholesterol/gamma-HCH transport system substrate-binding protein
MMEMRRNVLVGLFVLVGLIGAGTLAVLFGQNVSWLGWGAPDYTIRIHFESASGIRQDTLVTIGGLRVGSVRQVQFVDKLRFELGVSVEVVLDEGITLPVGSRAQTSEPGLGMGRPPIDIIPGPDDGSRLASGSTIPGRINRVMESLIPPTITATFEKTATQLGEAAAALTPVLEDMHEILQARTPAGVDAPDGPPGNLSSAMTRLDSTLKHFNTVLGDPQTQSSLKSAVTNIETMTQDGKLIAADLKLAASDARQFTTDARQMARDLSGKMTGTLENLDTRVNDLSRSLTADLELASTFLTQMNGLAERIGRGEGTIGRMMTDDRLYEAMTLTFRRLTETLDEFKNVAKQWQEGKIRVAF